MKNYKKGQTLLIIIMVMATALTIVMSLAFKGTTETQTTKLDEESQKALAAAEAGVEYALRHGNVVLNSLPGLSGGNITGSATIDLVQNSEFITPLILKDGQYTFYMSTPNIDFTSFLPPPAPDYNNKALTVCFGASAAVELTFVKKDGLVYSATRYAANSVGSSIITNASSAFAPSDCPAGGTFTSQYNITNVGTNNVLLFIRLFGSSGKVGLKGSGSANFPVQGTTATSLAKTSVGASKQVQLFQSYPQIPAEFFVTSF